MSKLRITIVAAIGLAFATPAQAAELSSGLAALQAEDYEKALAELRPLAHDTAEAAFALAGMYDNGWGVPASHSIAAGYYRRAMELGHAEATFRYAQRLEQGKGLPRDAAGALEHYKTAAEKDHPAAQRQLAKFHLFGVAKKPDFLEGRKWLNKAANAGDPEAEALIAELSARGLPILDIPGTAQPTEAAAKRVLGEVKDLIAPLLRGGRGDASLRLRRAPTVATIAEGHLVTLPSVEIAAGFGQVRLGSVQIAFKPQGDDYAVAVSLPKRASIVDDGDNEIGTLSLGSHKIDGTWSTALHTMTAYRAEFDTLKLAGPGLPVGIEVRRIHGERTVAAGDDGRQDVAERIAFEGVDLIKTGGAPVVGARVHFDEIGFAAAYDGLDLGAVASFAARQGLDWRTGAPLPAAEVAAGDEVVPPMIRAIKISTTIGGFTLTASDGSSVVSAVSGEIAFSGSRLDEALAEFGLVYGHSGLTVPSLGESATAAPQTVRLALGIERLPLAQLVGTTLGAAADGLKGGTSEAAAGGVPGLGLDAATKVLAGAGATVRLDEAVFAGEGYEIRVTGAFAPGESGVGGELDVTARGLDALLAARDAGAPVQVDTAKLDAVRALAVHDKDAEGRDVEVFRFALRPDGTVTVNGKATDLLN